MPILTDVSNFQVNNDCVFTWDSVLDAEYYELRRGTDWVNSVRVNGINIAGLSYQLSENIPGDYFIKAYAYGYDESAIAATVNLVAAPVLTDPANVTIVADELTFDLVPDATSYEIRVSQGYADTPGDSALVLIVADNTPLLVPDNSGKRFYVRALGNCLSKSPGYGTYFSEFDTNDDCGPVAPPADATSDTYYIDWFTLAIVDLDDDPVGNTKITRNIRKEVDISTLITPNGDALSNYAYEVEALVYSTAGEWATTGDFIYSGGGYGVACHSLHRATVGDFIVFRTAAYRLISSGANTGGPLTVYADLVSAAYCVAKITLISRL